MNLIYTSVPVHLTKDKLSSDNNALSENATSTELCPSINCFPS